MDTKGMTLRDYFAAKAMLGYITNIATGAELERKFDRDEKVAKAGDENESPFDYMARLSFHMADAMLAARLKQP